MAKRWDFKGAEKRFKKLKRNLPKKLGALQKNHFLDAFRQEGFTDAGFQPWKPRKRSEGGPRRAILVKSSSLKRSIRTRTARFNNIRTGSYGIRYSRRHNRGLGGMPKRQFVGKSAKLQRKVQRKIKQELKSVFS